MPAKAKLETIPAHAAWFQQNEIDWDKVTKIRKHLRGGGKVPPVVLARYGDEFMPIDGHHRMAAHDLEGLAHDAWVVPGHQFERVDRTEGRAGNHILCGKLTAFEVAPLWRQ